MTINNIVSGNQLPASNGSAGKSAMGKEDFLKLLLLQMRHQDPLNPLDNQAMLSQMAQFSSLEQMSNLNENFSKSNEMGAFMDATRLLGKEVELLDPSSSPLNPQTIKSKVTSVSSTTQGPLLKLQNGITVTVDRILRVNEPTAG